VHFGGRSSLIVIALQDSEERRARFCGAVEGGAGNLAAIIDIASDLQS
jgi:hypothetical protein